MCVCVCLLTKYLFSDVGLNTNVHVKGAEWWFCVAVQVNISPFYPKYDLFINPNTLQCINGNSPTLYQILVCLHMFVDIC